MQNTIENVAIRELAGDEQQAMELHMSILAHKELAAQHLVEFCRGLKEMRDGEGYRALGYERFEEYTEAMVDIKGRQAYYYISTYERLGAAVLSENAGLGITKLRLLAEVTAMDRGEFIAENDLDGMTVDEVRAAILERNGLREQLSLLEEAETPPVDVDAIKAEAVAAANAEAAKKQDKLVKDAIKEGEARAKNGYAGELAKAREAAAAEAREEARREMDAQLAVERQEKGTAAEPNGQRRSHGLCPAF